MAELEGGSVVFFVVVPKLGTVEAGSNVDCRVISYAWNWVLGSRPLIGRNRVRDYPCSFMTLDINSRSLTHSLNRDDRYAKSDLC